MSTYKVYALYQIYSLLLIFSIFPSVFPSYLFPFLLSYLPSSLPFSLSTSLPRFFLTPFFSCLSLSEGSSIKISWDFCAVFILKIFLHILFSYIWCYNFHYYILLLYFHFGNLFIITLWNDFRYFKQGFLAFSVFGFVLMLL